ncbi:cis-prenyltransferase [Sorochytrium milnesiophthora]
MDQAQRLLLWTLSHAGRPVPQHVAFVMDGNRRYAKKHSVHKEVGHYRGFKSLERTLDWCMQLGVKMVTVYAFSIDNFRRDKDEVDYLFRLFIEKMRELSEKSEMVKRHQVAIRIVGDVSMLPLDVQRAAFQAQRQTEGHSGATLNVCIPYTARNDIVQAVNSVRRGVQEGLLEKSDIDEHLLGDSMLTGAGIPPLDILVRTSGEIRLSDFVLWQMCDTTRVHFVAKAWPEFSFWDFLPVLLDYQMQQQPVPREPRPAENERQTRFLHAKHQTWDMDERYDGRVMQD